jgi:acrylyl-CoA reductase (NADPH)
MSGSSESFKALVLDRRDDQVEATIRRLNHHDLPAGEVLVRVAWSGLNYKDALAVTNRGRIVRSFPMVPGADLAGTVVASESPDFAPGEAVLVTGYGSGEDHWGGYTQLNRLQSAWLVPLPRGLSLKHAMAVGTAGFTAMLGTMSLAEHNVVPGDGEIIVTGAAGGVGSFAVALLSRQGYQVVAATGRPELADYLEGLGAASLVARVELDQPSDRPLASERWAGALDTVGGLTLANLIRSTRRHGSIAACGLAGGTDLQTTVYPFILRGVNLLGIDSNYCPPGRRREAWARVAAELPAATIDAIAQQVAPLEAVPQLAGEVLAGRVRGRIVVDLSE